MTNSFRKMNHSYSYSSIFKFRAKVEQDDLILLQGLREKHAIV
jgi:hypothetical protein